jgi:perosamine synthetase
MSVKSLKKSHLLENKIFNILSRIFKDKTPPFPLHEPCFKGNEINYLTNCIDTNYVSSIGNYVNQFENKLAEYTGAKHAIVLMNGTNSIQVSLRLCDVLANDEILVPSLTFVGTVNAICYLGAIPHFVDCEDKTFGINTIELRNWLKYSCKITSEGCFNLKTRRRIKAILPVHVFGHPCDIEGLLSIAKDFKLKIIEDAAEALGSFYFGRHVGTFGNLGIISFNGNKIITTGGGGAIITNDSKLAKKAKHLITTAKKNHPWEFIHDDIGYNFRMPNLNAALGCAQLEQIDKFLKYKIKLYNMYKKEFKGCKDLKLIKQPRGCRSNYWLNTIILAKANKTKRDKILKKLNKAGYFIRPVWRPIHLQKPYLGFPKSPMVMTEDLSQRIINLPSSVGLLL